MNIMNETKIYVVHMRDIHQNEFYLEFYNTPCYSVQNNNFVTSIKLFSIVLPDYLQRQGLGTQILCLLEEKVKQQNFAFIIEPVMEDAMVNLLMKRKTYTQETFFRFRFKQ